MRWQTKRKNNIRGARLFLCPAWGQHQSAHCAHALAKFRLFKSRAGRCCLGYISVRFSLSSSLCVTSKYSIRQTSNISATVRRCSIDTANKMLRSDGCSMVVNFTRPLAVAAVGGRLIFSGSGRLKLFFARPARSGCGLLVCAGSCVAVVAALICCAVCSTCSGVGSPVSVQPAAATVFVGLSAFFAMFQNCQQFVRERCKISACPVGRAV